MQSARVSAVFSFVLLLNIALDRLQASEPSIQPLILASPPGAVVTLAEGVYASDPSLDFLGRELTLEAAPNAAITIRTNFITNGSGGPSLIRAGPGSRVVIAAALPARVRSVLVLVHGQEASAATYCSFIERVFRAEPIFSETLLIELDWGYHDLVTGICTFHFSQTLDSVEGPTQAGAAKLAAAVAACRLIFGNDIDVNILCQSEGTAVTLHALEQGMQARNVVLMGSPLRAQDIYARAPNCLAPVLANLSGDLVNLQSPSDLVGIGCIDFPVFKCGGICEFCAEDEVCGIGNQGLGPCTGPQLLDARVNGVIHSPPSSDKQFLARLDCCFADYFTTGTPWWEMRWLQADYPADLWEGPLRRDDLLQLLAEGDETRSLSSGQRTSIALLQQWARTFPN
jgi:hypothetical protein